MPYLSPVSVLLAALAPGQAQAWLASTDVAALGLDTARLSLDLTATAGDACYVFSSNAALAPGNSIAPLDPQDPATWPGTGKGLTLVSGPVVGGAGATSVAADQLGPFLAFVRVGGTAAHNMLVSGQVGGTSTGGVASSVVNAGVASITGGTGILETAGGPFTRYADSIADTATAGDATRAATGGVSDVAGGIASYTGGTGARLTATTSAVQITAVAAAVNVTAATAVGVIGGTAVNISTNTGNISITANGVASAVNTIAAVASGAGGGASLGLVAQADGASAVGVTADSASGTALMAVGATGNASSIAAMEAIVIGGTGARVRALATGLIEFADAAAGSFALAATVAAAGVTAKAGRAVLVENSGGTFATGFAAPAGLGANLTYVLPATDGVSGSHLTTNGAGVLSWT